MNKVSPRYTQSLSESDPDIFGFIQSEKVRQSSHIELIASENVTSKAVREAQGSILTNKYAEGYPGRRYYGGCTFVDEVESLAIERCKTLFKCAYANVQPHSGAQANLAAFLAFLTPGDTFLGMSLAAGGHLTHGSPVTISGKWFKPVSYGVDPNTGYINYTEVEKLAVEYKPKLIIAGGSAYSRFIDFEKFRFIADQIGAYLMVDMAHFSGLVAGEVYPSPMPYAHIITSTTHKTLRGPRGGIILSNDLDLGKKINSAVFPGSQGGPLMHVIAAKAVAFKEALDPSFKEYASHIVKNAQTLANTLIERGFDIVSRGTDSHLILLDLRSKNITGTDAEHALERVGITCNKNSIPYDPLPPKLTSGIRLGTPAITSRGFRVAECILLGHIIADVLESFVKNKENNHSYEQEVYLKVKNLCQKFPIE